MGMYISAKLIYGIHYSEIPEEIREEVDQLIDVGDLDYASPWYDADREGWIVGYECKVDGDGYLDLSGSYIAVAALFHMNSINLKFYVSPHVY